MIVAVIPVYNESLTEFQRLLKNILNYVDKIIIVDDGSEEYHYDQLRSEKIIILRHLINRGQGAALRTGTQAALILKADIIIHLDADGQHSTEDIPSLIKPLQNENDLDFVLGSRFLSIKAQNMPWTRRLLLKVGRYFNILALGISKKITDPQSGMRALTKKGAMSLNFKQDRMAHASEILRLITQSGLKWKEVPITVFYSTETLQKGQKNTDALKIVWQFLISKFLK